MSVSKVGRGLCSMALVAIALLSSCFAEPNDVDMGTGGKKPVGVGGSVTGATGGDNQGGLAPGIVGECHPLRTAEPFHTREVSDAPQDTVVFVDDLFAQFKTHCGACHVDAAYGRKPFKVGPTDFFQKFNQRALDAIKSDVESCAPSDAECLSFMPPKTLNGKKWSERQKDPNDPIVQFVNQTEAWLAAKKPSDTFPPQDTFILPAEKGGKGAYPVSEDLAKSFSNLGTCLPDAVMIGTEPVKADALDAKFAAMKRDPTSASAADRIGLPRTLQETDLFSLDTGVLARTGVVAYQPTYPLWTDDAAKLRYIRVPRGESVRYEKDTKTFDIPDNTRFYKTFLKKIKTLTGEERFRKVETRVIVARKNGEALFGTYEWNDAENEATLLTGALKNGQPFADKVRTIVIDEAKAAEVHAAKERGEIRNVTYELDQAHAVRRYALPSSERCIQCHMGNESFVLAFSPLQVHRRPCDQETLDAHGVCEGGVLQPTGEDELDQLPRLIEYGVITGMDESDFPKLENPQGSADAPRKLRNDQELVAQGYLLGNCAHCHNPIGYPTVLNPELGPLLDFLPVGEGGIYEFPLERYSPRIKRGVNGDIPIPYITPSLRDLWPAGDDVANKWKAKSVPDPETNMRKFIDAPWRSLIYRNVDTPFTYADHFAIYPHMPLNSPGFDCRAPRILGEWMVSIPALRKRPELNESYQEGAPLAENDMQPYEEIKPSDERYELAQEQTRTRLEQYRNGDRFKSYCPDTGDIIDLDVLRGKRLTPADNTWYEGTKQMLPGEGVPDRSHWVETDLTEAPGEWLPRRADWKTILVDQAFPPAPNGSKTEELRAYNSHVEVVKMLQTVKLTDEIKTFGLKLLPVALWDMQKRDCNAQLAGQPKLKDFEAGQARANERMKWMDVVDPSHAKGTLPVYQSTPGEAVYNMICVNCHGPNADSKGRQATTMQDMTGGQARVANFRSGLFGPPGSGGENRKRVFGDDDVLASRYLPWMALGGTNTKIPQAILDLVNQTPVYGTARSVPTAQTTANMLQVAQLMCRGVGLLGTNKSLLPSEMGDPVQWEQFNRSTGLIVKNGDSELWQMICTLNNPPPVRVVEASVTKGNLTLQSNGILLYRASAYPVNTAVGDRFGRRRDSLTTDNFAPWCIAPPSDAAVPLLDALLTSDGKALPKCPEGYVVPTNALEAIAGPAGWEYVELDKWAYRGAINAGLLVFVYLDWLVSQDHAPRPRFNECELVKP
jgi:mono/diheme cytochrome c family protein